MTTKTFPALNYALMNSFITHFFFQIATCSCIYSIYVLSNLLTHTKTKSDLFRLRIFSTKRCVVRITSYLECTISIYYLECTTEYLNRTIYFLGNYRTLISSGTQVWKKYLFSIWNCLNAPKNFNYIKKFYNLLVIFFFVEGGLICW